MQENKNKILIIGIISIIIIIGGVLYYFFQNKNYNEEYLSYEENLENIEEKSNLNENIEKNSQIIVHISGQIINPGVITLKEGARLIDAINKAGGTTKEADLSKVNLAYILEDAQKIYIPSIKEKENEENILPSNNNGVIIKEDSQIISTKEEKIMININTASKEELQKLQGIGESTAKKIIAYRKENGKFNTIEDIKKVSGIGNSKFEKIKKNIYVK